MKELEESNSLLQEQLVSPPGVQEDDHMSQSSSNSQFQDLVDQLEFDKDEMEAKYNEIKVCTVLDRIS